MKLVTIPVTAFEQNCSLLICKKTNKAAVIDPGGDIEKIQRVIADNGCEVEKILITHGHIDHAGGANALAQALNVDIIGPHKDDAFWIEQIPQQAVMFQFNGGDKFQPNEWLNDGDEVTVGALTLKVLHCPGHTPGHVVFYVPSYKVAIVGDVLFDGSIGRTDFPKGNHQQLLDSISQKLWPLGEGITFQPGHGPQSTFDQQRKSNPYVADHVLGQR